MWSGRGGRPLGGRVLHPGDSGLVRLDQPLQLFCKLGCPFFGLLVQSVGLVSLLLQTENQGLAPCNGAPLLFFSILRRKGRCSQKVVGSTSRVVYSVDCLKRAYFPCQHAASKRFAAVQIAAIAKHVQVIGDRKTHDICLKSLFDVMRTRPITLPLKSTNSITRGLFTNPFVEDCRSKVCSPCTFRGEVSEIG
jgi:hypothetical protein